MSNASCVVYAPTMSFEEGPPYAFSATVRLLDGDQEIESFEALGTYGSKKGC
jgi:hypothetical protein